MGSLGKLPDSLTPLQDHTQDFQVLSGLNHAKAYSNGDGGGDHARANATFLTGCQARKTAGKDIEIGVSVDRLVNPGDNTKLRSLELSRDGNRRTVKVILVTAAHTNTTYHGRRNPYQWYQNQTPA